MRLSELKSKPGLRLRNPLMRSNNTSSFDSEDHERQRPATRSNDSERSDGDPVPTFAGEREREATP